MPARVSQVKGSMVADGESVRQGPERALLVCLQTRDKTSYEVEDSLAELAELASSAGAEVVDVMVQRAARPHPRYYIGRGKAAEVAACCEDLDLHVCIFDDELSPAQASNLEQAVGAKILDRTQLILDIFAQRARTKEGKLQVELAQLNYLLPRLAGTGTALSRLGGGIGTRGPGETQLEVDRRRIRKRIGDIGRELEEVRRHRNLHRKARRRRGLPLAALVGYTNAGKSTLMNRLAGADVFVADRLFATLDPTVRAVPLQAGAEVMMVDTVGFVRKLPHELVAAFRATLEEVEQADLLLHVVDAGHPRSEEQQAAVMQVLSELGVADKPIITVFNKLDTLAEPEQTQRRAARTPHAVAVSAHRGDGIEELRAMLAEHLPDQPRLYAFRIPYNRTRLVAQLHGEGLVMTAHYAPEGIEVVAQIRPTAVRKMRRFQIPVNEAGGVDGS